MAKLIINFAGTDGSGENDKTRVEHLPYQNDVIRIYIDGCQHPNVGGSSLFPDLDIAANNLRNAFIQKDGKCYLDLHQLQINFGGEINQNLFQPVQNSAAQISPPTFTLPNLIEVDAAVLQGFSRGAVTTFAAAKKMDDLNIPLDIIANQPVPGGTDSLVEGTGLYGKHHDLTACKNIRSATTLLVSHHLENSTLHNQFFQQMVAKFPASTKVNNHVFPHQQHLQWFSASLIPIHINLLFEKLQLITINPQWKEQTLQQIKAHYVEEKQFFYTPKELAQKIFGANESITVDPLYADAMKEKAQLILEQYDIPLSFSLSEYTSNSSPDRSLNNPRQSIQETEMARAIVAIDKIEVIKTSLHQEIEDSLTQLYKAQGITYTDEKEKEKKQSELNAKIEALEAQIKPIEEEYNKKQDELAQQKKDMITFITQNTPQSQALITAINKTHESCEYIRGTTKEIIHDTAYDTEKSKAIQKHSHAFQQTVFYETFNYLKKEAPKTQDKTSYVDKIVACEKEFLEKATEIDRKNSPIRIALKTLCSLLVKLTGLTVLGKDLDRALETGTLFHTRSSQITHQTTKEVIQSVQLFKKAIQNIQENARPNEKPQNQPDNENTPTPLTP